MKEKQKRKQKQQIINFLRGKLFKRILKIILVILIIAFFIYALNVSYNVGRLSGTIQGLAVASELGGGSLCDLIEKERDLDGFCILDDVGNFTTTIYKDCGYEKFKIMGSAEISFVNKVRNDVLEWIMFPILRC